MFASTLVSVLALASTAFAAVPRNLRARQAAPPVPDVTYPHDDRTAIWVVGFRHNVTWDATGLTGNGATIYLAKGGIQDPVSALASGFDIAAGRVEVTVPNVAPATDYTVHFALNGLASSSAPFTISTSKDQLPSSASAVTSGATTVVFPSTTVVTSFSGAVGSATSAAGSVTSSLASVTSAAGSSASSAISSISGAASSAASSLSAAQSSLSASASSHASSATAPLSSVLNSASSAVSSATSTSNGASAIALDTTVFKAMAAVGAIAFSAAVFVL